MIKRVVLCLLCLYVVLPLLAAAFLEMEYESRVLIVVGWAVFCMPIATYLLNKVYKRWRAESGPTHFERGLKRVLLAVVGFGMMAIGLSIFGWIIFNLFRPQASFTFKNRGLIFPVSLLGGGGALLKRAWTGEDETSF